MNYIIDNRDPNTTTVTEGTHEVTVDPMTLFKNALDNMPDDYRGEGYWSLVVSALKDMNEIDMSAMKSMNTDPEEPDDDIIDIKTNIGRRKELIELLEGAL